jgi:hypothetical protein
MMDVYVIEGDALMVAKPKDILDAQTAKRIVESMEIKRGGDRDRIQPVL